MIFVVPGLLSSALGCGGSSATASDVRMQEAQLEARRRTQERYAELLRLQNGSAGGEIADGEEPVGVTVNDVPIDPATLDAGDVELGDADKPNANAATPPEEATLAAASASSVAEARIRAAEARREAALRRLAAIRRGEPVPPAATPASENPDPATSTAAPLGVEEVPPEPAPSRELRVIAHPQAPPVTHSAVSTSLELERALERQRIAAAMQRAPTFSRPQPVTTSAPAEAVRVDEEGVRHIPYRSAPAATNDQPTAPENRAALENRAATGPRPTRSVVETTEDTQSVDAERSTNRAQAETEELATPASARRRSATTREPTRPRTESEAVTVTDAEQPWWRQSQDQRSVERRTPAAAATTEAPASSWPAAVVSAGSSTTDRESAASPRAGTQTAALPDDPYAGQRVALSVDDAPRRGSYEPLATVVVFSDFTCDACRNLNAALNRLVEAHQSNLQLVFRHNPDSNEASLAAETAVAAFRHGGNGSFWQMHGLLFSHEEDISELDLRVHAVTVGLDLESFEADLEARNHQQAVQRDQRQAIGAGVSASPTVFINGRRVLGNLSFERLDRMVQQEVSYAETLVAEGVASADVYATLVGTVTDTDTE